jgi:hypothetical protein
MDIVLLYWQPNAALTKSLPNSDRALTDMGYLEKKHPRGIDAV